MDRRVELMDGTIIADEQAYTAAEAR
jgi:hypothetical protein